MMKLISAVLGGVLLCLITVINGYPEPCDVAPKWVLDGVDPMEEFYGHVTLVACMNFHCEICQEQLAKLETLAQMLQSNQMKDVRFVIVASKDEHPNFIGYYKEKLRPLGIMVVQETADEPVWSYLNVTDNDFLIYDRCWRLRYYLPWPQSRLAEHKPIHNIYYAYHRIENPRRQCEQVCPAERPTRPDPRANRIGISSAKAVLSPSGNYRRPDNGHTEEFQSTTVNSLNGETTTDWTLLDTDESATVATDGDIQVEVITQKPSKRPKPTRPSNRQRNSTRGDRRKTTKTTTTTTTTTQTTTTPDCNEELCEYLEAENDQDTVKTATKANKKPSEEDDSEGKLEYSVETVTTATDKKPGSGPTVISPEKAKIVGSKPNSLEKSEEEILADLITTVKPTRRPYKGPSVSIPGLNCSAFTDYYCLQQQLADKPLPPCCFKGIYLTEVCDPEAGKCGKETENLCCLQKLQQSRFRCCHNSSTPNRLANDFSHCCFDHFALETPDDPCCPRSVAQKFWQLKASRVAELCQPNVQFDFSKVVLKSKLESGDPVEVDLGDSRIQAALNYECPYKSTEELYIYYPTDKDGEFDKEIKEIVDQHGDS